LPVLVRLVLIWFRWIFATGTNSSPPSTRPG
jgi:hypothetical protein